MLSKQKQSTRIDASAESLVVDAIRLTPDGSLRLEESVAIEAPVEIIVRWTDAEGSKRERSAGLLLATPTHLDDLARGFLICEGVADRLWDVVVQPPKEMNQLTTHRVVVTAPNDWANETALSERTTAISSCGFCGRLNPHRTPSFSVKPPLKNFSIIGRDQISAMVEYASSQQTLFAATGGTHAAALFDSSQQLLCLREDVGRHNALDKAIGWAAAHKDLDQRALCLIMSSRLSYDIVQKASAFGIAFIAAVGAPTSVALRLADQNDITLVGFVRSGRATIYSAPWRVLQ